MKASVLSFRFAVLILVAGVIWGIAMGISEDHSTFSAHAHLNLLGWVSLFLIGIYYHLHPSLDSNRLASMQVWIWIAATILLSIGIALINLGRTVGDTIAAAASLVILADTLLFGWLVYRRQRVELDERSATAPAE
jgi:cbb3-type cytochrome oxidase subunit 1